MSSTIILGSFVGRDPGEDSRGCGCRRCGCPGHGWTASVHAKAVPGGQRCHRARRKDRRVRFWEVVNFTAADHPFHAHGFFFQPIETLIVNLGDADAGVTSSIESISYALENKDTIRLPARPGVLARSWTITRLVVQFDDSARAASRLGLVRSDAQLVAFGKVPGGVGAGRPMLGDSGGWVFHCHINEHADQGMMSYFNLTAPTS